MPRKRPPEVATLAGQLGARSAPAAAELTQAMGEGRVRCLACGHRCRIPDGLEGICRVRYNRTGVLYAPRGYVAGLAVDPIEKKPFFHALPGATALSFGMLGCDFHCGYCQNWLTSQALRDASAIAPPRDVEPDELIRIALRHRTPIIVSTYNEPLITSEWAVEIFSRARREGIVCGFVSNGNATPEVLRYLRPWVDLYKVDLKSFRDSSYRELGGKLDNVLGTIALLHEMGFWVEIVTLLVPGWNDSEEEIRELARFLASVSPDIPWHVSAFHRDYKMADRKDTTPSELLRAARIGREAGLRFVYAGNLPGRVGEYEHTRCPTCGARVVARSGYQVLEYRLGGDGRCPDCRGPVAGYWGSGWRLPGQDGGLPGRIPRSVRVPAASLGSDDSGA
jgi:pyruvate formate lyase activating enzyme